MPNTPRLQRRTLFSLAGASLLSRPGSVRLSPAGATGGQSSDPALATPPNPAERPSSAASMEETGPALNVAGPRESDLAAWARLIAAPLATGLMQGGQLDLHYGGGVDGVTAANQFDARAVPDGREALLFPGSVVFGWLTGGRPVRIDCAHVLPLLAALGPGVLMVRGALPAPGGRANHPPLRLAGATQPNGTLVALLGLDLLGIAAIRVARESDATAVFLHGPHAAARVPGLVAAGYAPALSTRDGPPFRDDGADFTRAPFFLASLSATRLRHDSLVAAWHALAGAADLCAALVLPRLSPAESIGRWRHAAQSVVADDSLAARAGLEAMHLVAGEEAGDALAPMRLAPPAQIALRRWLSDRAGVQPG